MTGRFIQVEWTTNDCSSQKRCYRSRKDAKKVAGRKRRRGEKGMSVYKCEECGQIHIGHMPGKALRGEVSRAEIIQSGQNSPTREKKP